MDKGNPLTDWVNQIASAATRVRASDLYKGRSFKLARQAAETVEGSLYIVSAGLGLVAGQTEVPPYSATIVSGAPDSISDASGSLDGRWWTQLMAHSPFSLRQFPRDGLVLLALSRPYLAMVADDLAGMDIARLRIFTRASPAILPASLRPALMPYDERLDGPDSPIPGTISDFAQRALFHFVTFGLKASPDGSAEAHANMVAAFLGTLRRPYRVVNRRVTDAEIIEIVRANYIRAGNGAAMLRLLRDEVGVACEQSRFGRLFAQARAGEGK